MSQQLAGESGTRRPGVRPALAPKPNKYGQDLPGLEIAIEAPLGGGTDGADCYAPPFAKDLIKYPVGEPTITEINLLDWENGYHLAAEVQPWLDGCHPEQFRHRGRHEATACPTPPTACR